MQNSRTECLTSTKEFNDWLQNEIRRLKSDAQLINDSLIHQPISSNPRYHGKTSDEREQQILADRKKLAKIESTIGYLQKAEELGIDIDKLARVLQAEKALVCIEEAPLENGTAKLPVLNLTSKILSVSSPDPLLKLEIFPGQRNVYLSMLGNYQKRFYTFRSNGLEGISCIESISDFTSVVRLDFTSLTVVLSRYKSVEICSKTL